MRLRDLQRRLTMSDYDLSDALEDGFTSTHLRAVRHSNGDLNMVTYEGDITMKTGVADGDLVLTTPSNIAPKQDVTLGIFADDGSDYGVLRFEADGQVRVYGSLTAEKKYTVTGSTIIDPYNTR